uniref:Amino acid transporter transmembrane domain-containing protein n=1 Tax=Plectus sambesii TaxID=2011161 RepID=A0A914WWE1_9BILA
MANISWPPAAVGTTDDGASLLPGAEEEGTVEEAPPGLHKADDESGASWMTSFLVVVGDQSDTIFHDIFGVSFCDHWYMSRRFVVPLMAILFIWPLCYAKNIDFLKYPSGVATIGVFYLTGLTVYVYFTTDTSNVIVKKGPEVWSDVFSVVPAIMFAYQMHVSVIPVYSRVRPHNLANYTKMFSATLLVCFIAYTTVGTFGYLTFGTSIQEDLFSSYSTKNHWVMAGFVLFTIKTLLTYPILNFCGRLAVESVYADVRGQDELLWSESNKRTFGHVVSTIWFLSSLVVAVFVPNIASVVDFLGCLATFFILIFPGICLIRAHALFGDTMPEWKARLVLTVGCVFVVIGFFVFGMTLAESVEFNLRTAQPKHGKLLCP